MDVSRIIIEIDSQIAKLQQARELLSGSSSPAAVPSKRGRKPKSASVDAAKPVARKRNLSPEGRKAIADAMKRRWAARRTQKSDGK